MTQRVKRDDQLRLWRFRCPGCRQDHFVDGTWKFNGDLERPTFDPSILVRRPIPLTKPQKYSTVCHSNITDGRIEYHADCTHALAGKTVDLPAFEVH